MDKISVLIVEDEEIWIRNLEVILNNFGYSIAKVVSTAEDALEAFAAVDYDIILMDINLNGKNSGIELGKIVSKLYQKPYIFITASQDQHSMKEAAEASPSAYLPKPIYPSSLFIAIQNAINNFNNHLSATSGDQDAFSSFFIKQGNRYKKIDWKDVAYLSAGKNYVSVFNSIDKTEYFIRSSLQKTLQYLIPKSMQKQFVQLNRSEVVQIPFIQEIMNNEIKTLYKTFPLTEIYSKELRAKLNIVS